MPFTAKAGTQVNAFFESAPKVSGSIEQITVAGVTNQTFDAAGHCTFNIPSNTAGTSSNISYKVAIYLGTAPITLTLTLKQNGVALLTTGGDVNPTKINNLIVGLNPAPPALDYPFVLNFS